MVSQSDLEPMMTPTSGLGLEVLWLVMECCFARFKETDFPSAYYDKSWHAMARLSVVPMFTGGRVDYGNNGRGSLRLRV
ncbi:MAG: hypothetical protein Kow0060_04120 [Methylohalobius crimeensis]